MDSVQEIQTSCVKKIRRSSISGLGSLRRYKVKLDDSPPTTLRRTASCNFSASKDSLTNSLPDLSTCSYCDGALVPKSNCNTKKCTSRAPSLSGEEIFKMLPFHSEPRINISNPDASDQSSNDETLSRHWNGDGGFLDPRFDNLEMNVNDLIARHQLDGHFPFDILAAADPDFDIDWTETESRTENKYDLPGQTTESMCDVCYVVVSSRKRDCCNVVVCDDCLTSYIESRLNEGLISFPCPQDNCNQPIQAEELSFLLKDNESLRQKFDHLKLLANQTEFRKTCPNCCLLTEIGPNELSNPLVKKYGKKISCTACGFNWCFKCQTPEHPEVKCKDNRKGSKALLKWTKEYGYGQRNARKCPGCKILIQRNKGCDHMTCKQCDTSFCYKCGARHRSFKFLGNHWTPYSIFGCPYLMFDGKKKHLRRFIRGSIFAVELASTPIILALAIAALPLVGVAVIFGGPIVGFIKLHRHLQSKRRAKALTRRRHDPTYVL